MKRWLLWNFRCRRGRRCADVVITPEDTPPPGMVFACAYTCANCGTNYRWDSESFKRQRIKEKT